MMIFPARKWHTLLPAVALAALMFRGESAQAAFSVSLNGTQVAVDGGLNDTNGNAGEITFDVLFDGWRVWFTGRTTFSTATAGSLQISELLVQRLAPGSSNSVFVEALETEMSSPIPVGPSILSTTLTRNVIGPLGTSGTVSLTSTATDRNGNTAAATTPTLTPNPPSQGSGEPSTAFFNRQTEFYTLGSAVTVNGLGVGKGVSITADVQVIHAPAPTAAVMLLSGLPFLAIVRRLGRAK